MSPRPSRLLAAAVAAALALSVAGCSGSASAPASSAASAGSAGSAAPTVQAAAAVTPQAHPTYYVAIGDSYAAGYQPVARGVGHMTRNGYAYQTVTDAKARGYDLTLVNVGCSGATTASALSRPGCPPGANGPGSQRYTASQVDTAAAFIQAHRGHIALVTVTLGGNDLTGCNARHQNLAVCLPQAVVTIRQNLTTVLARLRSAAGGPLPIVGTTYPDFLLGNAVLPDAGERGLAAASVPFFRDQLNPMLASVYRAAGASFVDATAAFGGYTSTAQTADVPPYGVVPESVAKICTLTYYCQFQDIHPRTAGYAIMARLVAATLPQR